MSHDTQQTLTPAEQAARDFEALVRAEPLGSVFDRLEETIQRAAAEAHEAFAADDLEDAQSSGNLAEDTASEALFVLEILRGRLADARDALDGI